MVFLSFVILGVLLLDFDHVHRKGDGKAIGPGSSFTGRVAPGSPKFHQLDSCPVPNEPLAQIQNPYPTPPKQKDQCLTLPPKTTS